MLIPGQFSLICDRCRTYRRVWSKDDVNFVLQHANCHPQFGVRAVQTSYVPPGYVKAP